MTSLRELGEIEAIRRLTARLPSGADILVGAGDDCAVLRPSADAADDLLLTSDPVIEGTHFTPDAPRGQVGHKAVGRAVSDIAAMGGSPLWALVDVVAPPDTPFDDIEALYGGLGDTASRYGLVVVGGDLSHGPTLEIHVFAVGRVPAGTAVLRSGARPGELVYVTGALGGSRLGRHLAFGPRAAEGAWLRESARVSSMIDLSDGLGTDLRHLCTAGGVGAEIEQALVPVSREAADLPDPASPLDHALFDGEDFELLFTLPADRAADVESAWPSRFDLACTRIGRITPDTGVLQVVDASGARSPIEQRGFDPFG